MKFIIGHLILLFGMITHADTAFLEVNTQDSETYAVSAELKWIEGDENPLLCELADHRLTLIEDISQKIEYIHRRITPNIERWRHRRYLEEVERLEEQLEFNFNYLARRDIVLKAMWNVSELPEAVSDKIFYEEDLNSFLESPVLTLGSYGNLYYPEDLVVVDSESVVDGFLSITIKPSIQEYCSGSMDLKLAIELL
ncbi:MAG: hypothetical protein CL677_10495 [Bdellovibrionaceae bacterium]|nr:hypothetical protein [Pseudobdellovibrionaceae bacterium]|tara:strand:+ start:179642 stop:180232 length:591 start_codon:yes stop_codon:yes gene_type:complete